MNTVDSCITVLPGQSSSSEDEDYDLDDDDKEHQVVTGDCNSPNLGPPNAKLQKHLVF